ncbi:SulP family inorganic anion transporter [Bacteroidales bacterium AH-315-N07]|nr:SulP family inorganic anion transporter [Bacteroidales bacterium AH-315-N07]
MKNIFDFKNIKGDLFGGITAGIVALPLALAFGVQSGMGAIAGIYGAMVLGMFAAVFGGTATQVSGPTGPMTVISAMVVAFAIESSGSLQAGMGIIIASFLLAGGFQIVFGIIKIGKYIKYIPYPVLSGFMTGIGVIIILYQVYPFMGHSSAKSTVDIILNIGMPLSALNWGAIGLGGLTVAIIYLFPKISKAVPSALVALVVATLLATFMKLDVPVIGDIPSGIPELKIREILTIDPSMIWTIINFAVMLAALGAIDSLLTSVIADNITKTKHDSNRELIGQGIGNMVAALIGGLPGAGATMRTVVNVNAGGKTRLSGLIHGLLLLAILLGLGKYTSYIPLSVLAGILITVGIGIIDYKGLRHIRRVPRADAVILIIVLFLTVFGNLLQAVGVGIVLACVLFMKQSSDLMESSTSVKALAGFEGEEHWDDEDSVYKEYKGKIYIKHLYGQLFFGFTSRFQELIKGLHDIRVLIIRMDKVPHIDQSGVYAMEEAVTDLQNKDVVVVLTGVQPQPLDMLKKIDVIPALIPEIHVFVTFEDCEVWLKHNLKNENGGFDKIVEELHEVKRAKVAYQM